MTTVKPATAEQRAHWLTHANFKWQPYGSLFSEAVTAYEAALVALESELAALKAEYVPDPARSNGPRMTKFMEFAARVGCPPTGAMATNEAEKSLWGPSQYEAEIAALNDCIRWQTTCITRVSGGIAKAEATIETLTGDLMEARQEADNVSAHHVGTTNILNLLRHDIAKALGGVYGTPGYDCMADLTARVQTLRTERDEAAARFSVLWSFLQWVRTRDWTLDRLDQRAAELHDEGPAEIGINIVRERDDARAAAQVQADEIARSDERYHALFKVNEQLDAEVARLKAEHAATQERLAKAHAEWHALNDSWSELYATKEMEHAAEKERLAPAFRDHLETLKVNAQLMSEAAVLRAELQREKSVYETLSAVYDSADEQLTNAGFTECPPHEPHALDVSCRVGNLIEEHEKLKAELQRAHEAGETMQADASRWRLMAEATIRTLTADLAAAVKRADAAEAKLGQAIVALRRAKNEDQLYCDCDCDCDCSEFPGRAPGSIGTDVKTVLTDADRIATLTAELAEARQKYETNETALNSRDIAERVRLLETLLRQSKQVFDQPHAHDKGVACSECAMSASIGDALDAEGTTE